MGFNLIDMEKWKRKEWFEHYLNEVRCTYSMTVNIDITNLQVIRKTHNVKLYPILIFFLSEVVNKFEEFRMDFDDYGKLGYWDIVHPSYTIFNQESETFSSIWTEYEVNFLKFYNLYQRDVKQYMQVGGFAPKNNTPPNHFSISSIPWTSFTGFNLNIYGNGTYLRPIFTFGKHFEQEGKVLLPLSVQVHHAVCDGFHVSRLIEEFQDLVNKMRLE